MTAWLQKLDGSLFATRTLAGHLLRGALASGLVWFAVAQQLAYPAASLLAGLSALVLLRGCPVCWSIGLVETLQGVSSSRHPAPV